MNNPGRQIFGPSQKKGENATKKPALQNISEKCKHAGKNGQISFN